MCVPSGVPFVDLIPVPQVRAIANHCSHYIAALKRKIFNIDGANPARTPPPPSAEWTLHKPEKAERRRSCKLCYNRNELELKRNRFCRTCDVHLCFTTTRNCFLNGMRAMGCECRRVHRYYSELKKKKKNRVIDRLAKLLHLRNKIFWNILFILDFLYFAFLLVCACL